MLMVSSNKRKFFIAYCVFSYICTSLVIYVTLCNSTSYLAASIRLLKGIPLILMSNFILVNGLLLWQMAIHVLFGELRLIETEHIFENLGFTIINGIFISSTFKDHDFFSGMLLMALNISLKVLHWILADRLDHLYHATNTQYTLEHYVFSRFHFNLALFLVIDFALAKICFDKISVWKAYTSFFAPRDYKHNPAEVPFSLIFSVSFSVMFIGLLNLFCNSLLNLYEVYRQQVITRQVSLMNGNANHEDQDGPTLDDELIDEEPFENKYRWQVSVDIAAAALKIIVRLLISFPLGFPFIIIKDVVMDSLSLFNNGKKLYSILKNFRKLNTLLPDCSPDDISDENDLCTICMDTLIDSHSSPKKLPCGHILHLNCLKHWLERSQTCPICRVNVFDQKGNLAESVNNRGSSEHFSGTSGPLANEPNAQGARDQMPSPTPTRPHNTFENVAHANTRDRHLNTHRPHISREHRTNTRNHEPCQRWVPYEMRPSLRRIVFQGTNGSTMSAVLKKRVRPECVQNSNVCQSENVDKKRVVIPDLKSNLCVPVLQPEEPNPIEDYDREKLKRKMNELQDKLDALGSVEKSKRSRTT
ncbi:hypothetical protein ACO0QE_003452 [Hanseniaspora vineae]